jgi:tripartite-type tricarboxylate transporter receptor subunit TctC
MKTLFAALFALALSFPVAAQYPERPVTMLTGYPAGGLVDVVARLLAEGMKPKFPRGLVVQIKP